MIYLIAAIDLNSGLGKNNQLLTKQKADTKRFKELTSHHSIVVGRKTFESILQYNKNMPLTNRLHMVITTKYDYKFDHPDVFIYQSIEDVIQEYNQSKKDIWVIGGEEVYKQFLPYADELHLTIFHKVFEADTHFPAISLSEWEIKSNVSHGKDSENEYNYNFVVYQRKSIKKK